jgi:hypothetical protein
MRHQSSRPTLTPAFIARFSRARLDLHELFRRFSASLAATHPDIDHIPEGGAAAAIERVNTFAPTINAGIALFNHLADARPGQHSAHDSRLSVEVRAAIRDIDAYLRPLVRISRMAPGAGEPQSQRRSAFPYRSERGAIAPRV